MRVVSHPRPQKSLQIFINTNDHTRVGYIHKYSKWIRSIQPHDSILLCYVSHALSGCQFLAQLKSLLYQIARSDEKIMCEGGGCTDCHCCEHCVLFIIVIEFLFKVFVKHELCSMSWNHSRCNNIRSFPKPK